MSKLICAEAKDLRFIIHVDGLIYMTIFKRHFQILFPLVNIFVFSELLPFLEAVSNPPKDEQWIAMVIHFDGQQTNCTWESKICSWSRASWRPPPSSPRTTSWRPLTCLVLSAKIFLQQVSFFAINHFLQKLSLVLVYSWSGCNELLSSLTHFFWSTFKCNVKKRRPKKHSI